MRVPMVRRFAALLEDGRFAVRNVSVGESLHTAQLATIMAAEGTRIVSSAKVFIAYDQCRVVNGKVVNIAGPPIQFYRNERLQWTIHCPFLTEREDYREKRASY